MKEMNLAHLLFSEKSFKKLKNRDYLPFPLAIVKSEQNPYNHCTTKTFNSS
jgi:hypothetical protein